MTVTLCKTSTFIQTLRHSKWHWDIRYFSECLGIIVEQANSFIRCVEKGRTGKKADGLWKANTKPFQSKINLTQNQKNTLNLYYTDQGDNNKYSGACNNSRYICLGRISSHNNIITLKIKLMHY